MSELEANESAESPVESTEELSSIQIEKIEEAKLRAKYPMAGGGHGHSTFLQKKILQKGQKYFDSGDYQMARQKSGPREKPMQSSYNTAFIATGEEIPTPESVPVRKTSIIQPKFHPSAVSPP